jgi:hypothetical protein
VALGARAAPARPRPPRASSGELVPPDGVLAISDGASVISDGASAISDGASSISDGVSTGAVACAVKQQYPKQTPSE